MFADKGTTHEFAHEKHTKAPEGAATGAGTGGVIGGAGLDRWHRRSRHPGRGPFHCGRAHHGLALSGAAIGAAVGGVAGGLIGLGIPELEAKRYEGLIKEGNILISVHTENSAEISRAKDIFSKAGGKGYLRHRRIVDASRQQRLRPAPPTRPIRNLPAFAGNKTTRSCGKLLPRGH